MNKTKFILILLIVALLSGCASHPLKSSEFNEFSIIQATIDDNLGIDKNGNTINAEAEFFTNGICKIKLPTIKDVYDSFNLCNWGHELAHCIMGTWHDEDEIDTCSQLF